MAVALAACNGPVPAPGLCDMPPGFSTWTGAQVRWTGVVIGEPHHGYILSCEHHRGGIRIDWNDQTVGASAFQHALEAAFPRQGLLRITVEARLGCSYGPGRYGLIQDPPVLRISAVKSIEWMPMTAREESDFLDRPR